MPWRDGDDRHAADGLASSARTQCEAGDKDAAMTSVAEALARIAEILAMVQASKPKKGRKGK